MTAREPDVTITLTGDEAIVLFEYLARTSKAGRALGPSAFGGIEDQAELRALWNLEALLERQLVAPFAADHTQRLG